MNSSKNIKVRLHDPAHINPNPIFSEQLFKLSVIHKIPSDSTIRLQLIPALTKIIKNDKIVFDNFI
jgi:hypothetical protein